MKRSKTGLVAVASAILAVVIGGIILTSSEPAVAGTAYYIDCAGSDTAAGTTEATAWKTIAKANKADLNAGDQMFFKRGCTWTGTALRLKWIGTTSSPITFAPYGIDLAQPKIANANINITGKYQVVDGFEVGFAPIKIAPGCAQPLGIYYAMLIAQGGGHNTIQNNLLTTATAGLHLSATGSGFNKIYNNTFANNNVMQEPFDGNGDLGAWGMLVRSNNNDIAYNTFRDNKAVCSFSNVFASNSVEIYEADNTNIHHNIAINDRVFSELGGSPGNRANDNYFGFNLSTSNLAGARFITTRGSGNQFGPVNGTVVERNTIDYTGVDGQGLVCSSGCNPNILTAKYNIINIVSKAIFYDKTMRESNNLIWAHGGAVHLQDGRNNHIVKTGTVTPAYIVGDPNFTSATDFILTAGSPAINTGGSTKYPTDLLGNPAINEIGAYEYTGL